MKEQNFRVSLASISFCVYFPRDNVWWMFFFFSSPSFSLFLALSAGYAVECKCCLNVFVSSVLLSLKSITVPQQPAYIKNQLTGLLFSDANPVGFRVFFETPVFDRYIDLREDLNHHWHFANYGGSFPSNGGCLNCNCPLDRSYWWQNIVFFFTALSVLKHLHVTLNEAWWINSKLFTNESCVVVSCALPRSLRPIICHNKFAPAFLHVASSCQTLFSLLFSVWA